MKVDEREVKFSKESADVEGKVNPLCNSVSRMHSTQ